MHAEYNIFDYNKYSEDERQSCKIRKLKEKNFQIFAYRDMERLRNV